MKGNVLLTDEGLVNGAVNLLATVTGIDAKTTAATAFSIKITTGATGTSQALAADVFGYLV